MHIQADLCNFCANNFICRIWSSEGIAIETVKGKSKIINRVALLLMLITADQPFSNGYMRTFIIVPHIRGNSYSHCPTYIQLMYTHK